MQISYVKLFCILVVTSMNSFIGADYEKERTKFFDFSFSLIIC
jgi:hypothetical protein